MSAAPSLDRLRQSLSNVTWRETLGKGTGVVVPLNDQGARIPFFCVHSLTGKATDYVPLAQKLGPDQPFFSIQIPPANRSPDYAGLIAPLSIPAIATHYIDAIAALRPTGAIALGGWSIGAIIALEMAQQLKARGREVALLVVVDMIPWNTAFPHASRVSRMIDTALQSPAWLAAHKLVRNGVRFRALGERARLKLAALTAKLRGRPVPPKEEMVGDLVDIAKYAAPHLALMEQMFASAQTYMPQPYDGAVQVYAARADVALDHLAKLRWGWRHIAPHSRVTAMPGAHQTLFNGQDGHRLAAHLAELLAALGAA
jgi:thioesterase domain-containing protein